MHFLATLVWVYPFWAAPLILILGEVGIFFRRKKHNLQYACWGAVLLLVVCLILWVVFRGDLNSGKWVKSFLEGKSY